MSNILSDKTVKARKDHNCTACNFILNAFSKGEYELNEGLREFLTDSEIKGFRQHIEVHNSTIKKGQVYRNYAIVEDGNFWHCKEFPVCRKICINYGMYEG